VSWKLVITLFELAFSTPDSLGVPFMV